MSTRNKMIALVVFTVLMLLCLPVLAAEPDSAGVLVDTSTYIYAETYKGRTDITSVSLPNATYIGASAFQGCTELVSVDAPNVTGMGTSAFSGCKDLTTVSMDSIHSISELAFLECESLESVSLSSVITIKRSAFSGCKKLVDFPFSKVEAIEWSAFSGCGGLASVNAPVLKTIGYYAFGICTDLVSIDAPMCVDAGYNTFYGCISLAEVNLPNVSQIGSTTFENCSSLQELSLPAAFRFSSSSIAGCISLTSLRLDSVETISETIPCPSLKHLAIPAAQTVTTNAFQYCAYLETLVISNNLVESVEPGTIPNNSKLSIYVPNAVVELARSKIASTSSLHTTVNGYDAPIIKKTIFFPSRGGSKSCVIIGSLGTQFKMNQGISTTVDSSGVITDTGLNEDSVIAYKYIDVAGFKNLLVSSKCAIRAVGIGAYASSLTDGSTGRIQSGFTVYPKPFLSNYPDYTYIRASQYPTFTFRSYDDEWYEITYGTNTGYVPKPCIALEGSTDPIPDPGDSGGSAGDSTTPTIPGGSSSGQGVQMTVNINGKNTEVVLSLANFTYDYDQPETVTMIAGFNLRKGPNAAFGTYRNVRKGTQLTIIGRDREWLKVDMGNGKIAYVLEDMTTK